MNERPPEHRRWAKYALAALTIAGIATGCTGDSTPDPTGPELVADAEQAVLGVAAAVTNGVPFDQAVDSYQFGCANDLRLEGTEFILELPAAVVDNDSAERAFAYLKSEGFDVVMGGDGSDPAEVFVAGSKHGTTVGAASEGEIIRIDAITPCYKAE